MMKYVVVALMPLTLAVPARAQDKPALLVHAFTLASGVDFPYDMKDLQTQTIGEIKAEDGEQFDAVSDAPSAGA